VFPSLLLSLLLFVWGICFINNRFDLFFPSFHDDVILVGRRAESWSTTTASACNDKGAQSRIRRPCGRTFPGMPSKRATGLDSRGLLWLSIGTIRDTSLEPGTRMGMDSHSLLSEKKAKRRSTKRTLNGGVYIRPGGLDTVYR
jgi:hypothetical protein